MSQTDFSSRCDQSRSSAASNQWFGAAEQENQVDSNHALSLFHALMGELANFQLYCNVTGALNKWTCRA